MQAVSLRCPETVRASARRPVPAVIPTMSPATTLPVPAAALAVPDPRCKAMEPLTTAVIVVAIWIPIHMKLSRWIEQR